MMLKFNRIWGCVIAAFVLWAELTGFSFADVDEVHAVPRTVRDNPGVYRSHYQSHVRYSGGK